MSLIDQNEYLKEENRQLRAMLVTKDFQPPREWKLSPCEQKLLGSLYSAASPRSPEALRVASCRDEEAFDSVIQVRICTMRKKLKPFSIVIKTIYGEGYELTKESKLIVEGALSR